MNDFIIITAFIVLLFLAELVFGCFLVFLFTINQLKPYYQDFTIKQKLRYGLVNWVLTDEEKEVIVSSFINDRRAQHIETIKTKVDYQSRVDYVKMFKCFKTKENIW